MNWDSLIKVVINLPHRTDRMKQFEKECASCRMSGPVYLSPGIIDKEVHKGIGQAHMNAMELGFSKGDMVLVMEDDIMFPGRLKTVPFFNECLVNAPKDWDFLLGGVYNKFKVTCLCIQLPKLQ